MDYNVKCHLAAGNSSHYMCNCQSISQSSFREK